MLKAAGYPYAQNDDILKIWGTPLEVTSGRVLDEAAGIPVYLEAGGASAADLIELMYRLGISVRTSESGSTLILESFN